MFCSDGTYPFPVLTNNSIWKFVFSSTLQIVCSGFIISISGTKVISFAFTSLGPLASKIIFLGEFVEDLSAKFFTFKTISVTSSLTPLIDENSWRTPSICTPVTAAPCIDDKRILLKVLPIVWPNPFSKGSATTFAIDLFSLLVIFSLLGFISAFQFLSIFVWPVCIYTLLFFGGLVPLCGIGVVSLIDKILKPFDCKALKAVSLPDPGPLTWTTNVLRPCS